MHMCNGDGGIALGGEVKRIKALANRWADDGEDFREALITPVFQELAYVSAQRLNPWFQPWMYTKATDFMLDVVDGLEEGFAASSEGLVCLATGILLRYLGAHAIDSSKLEVTANLCLTIASKFNERMYVPLSRGAKHDVIEPSTGTVVARSALELEVSSIPIVGSQ